MRSGNLRTRITIQAKSVATDSTYGGQSVSWGAIAEVSAEVVPLHGRELVAAQAIHAETSLKVRIRYRNGIAADQRLVIGGVTHDITAVINDRLRSRELILYAKSGVSNG